MTDLLIPLKKPKLEEQKIKTSSLDKRIQQNQFKKIIQKNHPFKTISTSPTKSEVYNIHGVSSERHSIQNSFKNNFHKKSSQEILINCKKLLRNHVKKNNKNYLKKYLKNLPYNSYQIDHLISQDKTEILV